MPRPKKSSTKEAPEKTPIDSESNKESDVKSIPVSEKDSDKVVAEPELKEPSQELKEVEIRVLYSSQCEKLTSRGQGKLQYEIGFNDISGESYIRIVACGSTGAFSNKWVAISDIRSIIDNAEDETFRAVILRDLHKGKSSNNHGFLGAVLKHLGVVAALPEQPTVLCLESWAPLLERIESLKEKGMPAT